MTDPLTGSTYGLIPPWTIDHQRLPADPPVRYDDRSFWVVQCWTTMPRRVCVIAECATQEDAQTVADALNRIPEAMTMTQQEIDDLQRRLPYEARVHICARCGRPHPTEAHPTPDDDDPITQDKYEP